ncbi:MAG: aldehyde dehydrogenase family protein [Leucobacter sp.]
MAEQRMLEESVWQVVASAALERTQHWKSGKDTSVSPTDGTGVFDDLAGNAEYLDFTKQLIDALLGSADSFTAAMDLRDISQQTLPENMPARDRLLLRAGGVASLGVPWMVGLAARRRLLSRLPGIFLGLKFSGKLQALTEVLRTHSDRGHSALVALYGDSVHGATGGEFEVDRLISLAKVPAVKHLAFDPARVVPEATDWSIDADLQLAATRLQPLLDAALEHGVRLIVEPRDTKWAKQLPELLVRALADPRLDRLEVGVALLAELPESWESYASIHRYARRRVADGGAPVEVIIGLTDTVARERAASIHTGLPVAVLEDPTERTAQLLRLTELALHPSRAAVLRPVIATEHPLVAAAVIEAAAHVGAEKLYALQLRAGVKVQLAKHLATEEKSRLPEVRLRLPVTQRGEFGEISDYLVSRIADAVAPELPDVAEALRLAELPQPSTRRTQQRAREWDPTERDSALFYRAPDEQRPNDTGGLTAAVLGLSRGSTGEVVMEEVLPARSIPVRSRSGFANEPATDGAIEANREWARGLLRRAGEVARHGDGLDETIALSQADLDPTTAARAAREAAGRWTELEHENRSVRLRRVALATAAARDRLITELATDTGAPIVELDSAVNYIIDAARYAGKLADELRVVRGARFVPDRLVLVVADATAPLATQAASVLAVLGTGAGALWAVSPGMMRSATACAEEWEAGGLTPGAVRIVSVVGEHTFAALGASTDVDRAIVLGDQTLGRELARRRPDLRVEGHFIARGSVVVTPSAERDRAIEDIVTSVFGGTETTLGQARMVILVGALGRSREFRDGLADAVRSLRAGDSVRPGDADSLQFDIGPLPAVPSTAARAALSELGSGEEWLVKPEQLDEEGRLWSPGIRLGVDPGSPFWDDAAGLPVFGISTVSSLNDAIAHQNTVGSGAVAGIQSWDEQEVLAWLSAVEAGSLSVNRPTSGARIDRQPSGGWNEAVMGLPSLVGGPHWLLAQGSWELRTGKRSETLHLRGLTPEVVLLIEAAQPLLSYEEFDEVRRAALADQLSWQTSLGLVEDEVGLGIERNALRTQPVSVQLRLAEEGSLAALVRVLAAALLVRAPVTVSTGGVLPQLVADCLASQGIEVSLERDDAWLERLAVSGPAGPGGSVASRVRLIGGNRVQAAEWMGGLDRSALWAEPVTMAGPVELLALLREQSVSVRAERHGFAERAAGLDSLLE